MKYDKNNGEDIVKAMNANMMSNRDTTHVEIGSDKRYGNVLVIDQVWDDGQRAFSRWVVPEGHSINVKTGEVTGPDKIPMDYENIIKTHRIA